MIGATDGIAGGVDRMGRGGVDALSVAYNNKWYWWEGGNYYWPPLCNMDGTQNDSRLTVHIDVTAGHHNAVALAWLTRGTYTFDHQYDPHPIGTDFDFDIVNVTGPHFYASSASWDDPFEFVNFWAPHTQTLRVRIRRTFNRDTSANYKLALAVKYW